MAILLRTDLGLTDDDEILIHMGEGACRVVIRAAINNYWKYNEIREPGAFTVSVYGAIRGVTEEMIVEAMPHKKYGTTTYGELRRTFDIVPTTIEDAELPEDIKAVHFDIVLPDGGYRFPTRADGDDLTADQLAEVSEVLAAPVDQLLSMFLPRRSK